MMKARKQVKESEALRASMMPDPRESDRLPPPDLMLSVHSPPPPPTPEPAKDFYYALKAHVQRKMQALGKGKQLRAYHYNAKGDETIIDEFGYQPPDLVILTAGSSVILAHVASLQLTLREIDVEPETARRL